MKWPAETKKIILKAETNLFNGVAIYFNGHTDKVGVLQLKQAVQKNGGMVNYAFSVTHTTHIVCTNLCASKLNAFSGTRPLKKKIHIVHPDWIIDSLKAHELQPESKYEIVVTKDTTTIMDFLPSKEDQKADSKSEAKADSDDGKEDSSSTSNEAEESVALESGSMSLSLSTQESQEKDKQYKPVQHPLLHSRRSSTSSHSASRSKSSMDQFPNRVQPSVKQARYNSIMKRGLIRNAQKSFR